MAFLSAFCVWLCLMAGESPAGFEEILTGVQQHKEIRALFEGDTLVFCEILEAEIDESTFTQLKSSPIGRGTSGENVVSIQKALAEEGLLKPCHGYFGEETESAVKTFQRARGISATGSVDSATWSALLFEAKRDLQVVDLDLQSASGSVTYAVHAFLEIREETKGDSTRFYKRELKEIGEVPAKSWTRFLDAAIRQGLYQINTLEREGRGVVELSFRRLPPSRIESVGLALPADLFVHFKMSDEHGYRLPERQSFVVFVHEPHWDIGGQFQVIEGLNTLVSGNHEIDFAFLVEGQAEFHDIPTDDIQDLLAEEPGVKRAQVYQMVREFLLDSPMAYRLLYNPSLPAVAIDNQELLATRHARYTLPSYREFGQTTKAIREKLSEGDGETLTAQLEIVALGFYVTRRTGAELITAYEEFAEYLSLSAGLLRAEHADELRAEIAFLNETSKGLRSEAKVYKTALLRDEAMAKQILVYCGAGKPIPVTFIGNFHTDGIIENLPPDFGYIVLEPRHGSFADEQARQKFDRSLRDYDSHLRKVIDEYEKLRVRPPKRSLARLKKHLDDIKARVEKRRAAPGRSKSEAQIVRTVAESGLFEGDMIGVAAAGGANSPPPPFSGSFGVVRPREPGGGRGRLTIVLDGGEREGAREARAWRRAGRLGFLRVIAPLDPPREIVGALRTTFFYQDTATKRVFYAVFDHKTRRFYLFESTTLDGVRILDLPNGQGEVHLKLVELCTSRMAREVA